MGIPWDGMGWDRHNLLWDGMGWDRKICPMDKPGILSRRKQEERKSRNQDFKAAPAWSIISGQMESGPEALPENSAPPRSFTPFLLFKFDAVVIMHGGTIVQNSKIHLTELWANV